ncbi:integrase family protein [Rhizobium sp. L43]|uniref:tyrosine-type recombinase/integrase n=1 Tax=Rhizobium sp. L43 TaxID=2035452 RepID=UPI000BE7B264|nr:integrase family protein [Rhizobium sp. L43]PDS76383.1 integrase [Rhizobium sp. L43]
MRRTHLNDKIIANLPFAVSADHRYEIPDSSIENLAIRVGSKSKTFTLTARFGGSPNPSRRPLGKFPKMSTATARTIADNWNDKIKKGQDPAAEEARRREREARKNDEKLLRLRSTFASVMEDYIVYLPTRERNRATGKLVGNIQREFLNPDRNPWMNKPISQVTDSDVSSRIAAIADRGAKGQARECLKHLRTFFRWAMLPHRRDAIGLARNPIADLTPSLMKLPKNTRSRHFGYLEIQAYIATAASFEYPYGPFARALIEMGQRREETARMRWSHLDLERKVWTIPGGTSKPETDHVVYLSDCMVGMLKSLKRAQVVGHGDYVFSSSHGQRPIAKPSWFKGEFEKKFAEELERIAPGASLRHWTWHDVRRTVRTQLEPIVGRSEVAEAAIGHGKTGIERVYNLYTYARELRTAFNAWSEKLRKMSEGTLTLDDWEDWK